MKKVKKEEGRREKATKFTNTFYIGVGEKVDLNNPEHVKAVEVLGREFYLEITEHKKKTKEDQDEELLEKKIKAFIGKTLKRCGKGSKIQKKRERKF